MARSLVLFFNESVSAAERFSSFQLQYIIHIIILVICFWCEEREIVCLFLVQRKNFTLFTINWLSAYHGC